MAAPDLTRVFRVPGRLVSGPTAVTGSYPYGGTGLGLTGQARLRIETFARELTAMEFGAERVERTELGQRVGLACVLRDWDDDALAAVFGPVGATAAGTASARRVITYPGATFRAGQRSAANGIKLLWAPDDPGHHPAVLLYRAMPHPEATAELVLRLDAALEVGVVFSAVRDGTGRLYQLGPLEDMTL